MNKEELKIWREKFRAFLDSEEPYIKIPVDGDLEKRRTVPFKVIFPGLKTPAFYLRHCFARIIQFIDYSPVKVLLYRLIGVRIGKGVFIAPDVIIDVQFPRLVEVGDYAILGWGSKLFVHDNDGVHYHVGRVRIGKGAVVGGFSFIRAGVTIGENALVKLGSTIFRSEDENIVSQEQIRARYTNKD